MVNVSEMVVDARRHSEHIWLLTNLSDCNTENEAKAECISCAPNDAVFQNVSIIFPEGLDIYSVPTPGSKLCLLK